MLLVADFSQYFFGTSIFITSVFLVMLVLVQRGRGGGLTGALGGAGGQSAFGTKAGDLFTRITIVVAAVWITLCAGAVYFLRDRALPGSGVETRPTSSMTSTADPLVKPAATSPANDGLPAMNTPVASTPAASTPAATAADSSSATPAMELTPATDATPAEQTPVAETPADETPGADSPAESAEKP